MIQQIDNKDFWVYFRRACFSEDELTNPNLSYKDIAHEEFLEYQRKKYLGLSIRA